MIVGFVRANWPCNTQCVDMGGTEKEIKEKGKTKSQREREECRIEQAWPGAEQQKLFTVGNWKGPSRLEPIRKSLDACTTNDSIIWLIWTNNELKRAKTSTPGKSEYLHRQKPNRYRGETHPRNSNDLPASMNRLYKAEGKCVWVSVSMRQAEIQDALLHQQHFYFLIHSYWCY